MKYFEGSMRCLGRPVLLAFIVALLGALPAYGQHGSQVKSIDIQYTGPETISRERILSQIRTRVGDPYSDAVVEGDIRNLYKTGALQNVRIFGAPDGEGGVKVVVAVQTRAIVNEIEIAGAERLEAKRLRKSIEIKINTPLNETALEEGRQKIIERYKAKGYNDVDVQFRVDTNEARGTSRVVYTIDEGTKGVISDIYFEGNNIYGDRVLRKQMKTRGRTLISLFDKSGRLNETQLQQDIDAVREWYQDHGYIDIEIKEVRRDRTKGKMSIVVVLNEGQKYHVGKISIKGYKATTEPKLRAILKMKEGGVYSPKGLREDAKAIADAYGAGGYVDLNILPQSAPAGAGRIDVNYTIDEGTRSFVQRISITGNTRTKDKVIRREVLIAPGDVFNTVRVDLSKKRLDNLGYFAKVETFPEDTGVPGRKDLTVQVEEKRTGSLNFGAGFSTIDNIVGFVEMTQGNFDIMNWPNFTGAGQKFRARVQLGSRRQDFILALTEPYFLDMRLSLGVELFYREAQFLSSRYNQRNYGFTVEARKPIARFTSLTLQYRLENIDIFDVSIDASDVIIAEAGSRIKSQVTPSLIFDTRDNPFLTRRGQRIVLTPYAAGGFLGGNTQILGFDFEASQYFRLWWDTILLFNGQVAAVDGWGDNNFVPIFDRLFLGGTNTLRGFDFRDVGPKDEDGEPVGGRTMARFTVEYTYPIIPKVRAAIFYDTGFVNSDALDFGTDHLASDYGFGVRLDLPVGPIRVDYGIPIKTDGNSDSPKFNFSVGYQF